MKIVLDWIRSNPVTTGAAVVALASVLSLLVLNNQGSAFIQQMNGRGAEIRRIQGLQRIAVKIPPAKPDAPERRLQIAVNQAAIDQLALVYHRMNREYAEVYGLATQFNRRGHRPMIKGLFPEPIDASKPFEVRDTYRAVFTQMLAGYEKDTPYPRLNASGPPSPKQMEALLEKTELHFLRTNFFPPKESVKDLTEAQAQELKQLKTKHLIESLQDHARSIHLYADTDIESPGFAFDVGPWSKPGLRPPIAEIWEGQLGLWIQLDIAQAIAHTNLVHDTNSNVMNAPIKRLLGIQVVPGYVGIPIESDGAQPSGRSRATRGQPTGGPDSGEGPPDDFVVSPSGRRSNAMYDVRHAKASLIIDAQAMPRFFQNLQRVNFMTVLHMEVTDIDEYAALRQGYVYGSGDAVQVEMLIETIWLRGWTQEYMPADIKRHLGIGSAEASGDDKQNHS